MEACGSAGAEFSVKDKFSSGYLLSTRHVLAAAERIYNQARDVDEDDVKGRWDTYTPTTAQTQTEATNRLGCESKLDRQRSDEAPNEARSETKTKRSAVTNENGKDESDTSTEIDQEKMKKTANLKENCIAKDRPDSRCKSIQLQGCGCPSLLLSDARIALREGSQKTTQSRSPPLSGGFQVRRCAGDSVLLSYSNLCTDTNSTVVVKTHRAVETSEFSNLLTIIYNAAKQLDSALRKHVSANRDHLVLKTTSHQTGVVELRNQTSNQILTKIPLFNLLENQIASNVLSPRFSSRFEPRYQCDSCDINGNRVKIKNNRKYSSNKVKQLSAVGTPRDTTTRQRVLKSQLKKDQLCDAGAGKIPHFADDDPVNYNPSAFRNYSNCKRELFPPVSEVDDFELFPIFQSKHISSHSFDSTSQKFLDSKPSFITNQLIIRLLPYLNLINLDLYTIIISIIQEKDDVLFRILKEILNVQRVQKIPLNTFCSNLNDKNNTFLGKIVPEVDNKRLKVPEDKAENQNTDNIVEDVLERFESKSIEEPVIVQNLISNTCFISSDTQNQFNESLEIQNAAASKKDGSNSQIHDSIQRTGLDPIDNFISYYKQSFKTDEHLRQQIQSSQSTVSNLTNDCLSNDLQKNSLLNCDANQKSSNVFSVNLTSLVDPLPRDSKQLRPSERTTYDDNIVKQTKNHLEEEVPVEIENFKDDISFDEWQANLMNSMKQKPFVEEKTASASDNVLNCSSSMEFQQQYKPLKSALKKPNGATKSGYKSGYRVKFDESLNKKFDADYVILVREESEMDDRYGEMCECGDEFCDGRFYDEDEESDDEDFILSNCPHENQFSMQNLGSYPMPSSTKSVSFRPRNVYDFSPASTFEPPLEFVDQDITLSPPDGYKDGCCSHQFSESISQQLQSEQFHSTSNKKNKSSSNWMETDEDLASESQIDAMHEHLRRDDIISRTSPPSVDPEQKPNGILKGGKLYEKSPSDLPQVENKNYVTFNEQEKAEDSVPEINSLKLSNVMHNQGKLSPNSLDKCTVLKLGNLNSNHSLKPNSAVRQLFPTTNFISPPQLVQNSPDSEEPFLSSSNSRIVPNSSLFYSTSSLADGDDNDEDGLSGNSLFKKTIEKNTLRRSLIRYPKDVRKRKCKARMNSNENSLVERIRKLTCDIGEDEPTTQASDEATTKPSEISETENHENPVNDGVNLKLEKPTTLVPTSNPSGVSSTYKKLTDLFSRKSDRNESNLNMGNNMDQNSHYESQTIYQTAAPDLGNGLNMPPKYPNPIVKNSTAEARKQFLSTLAPLTACVSGNFESPTSHGTLSLNLTGNRNSVASVDSNVSLEYSLNDIDEALSRSRQEQPKLAPQPDVIAGTPAGNSDSGNNDELALFVQQDASRIERIKNRYGNNSTAGDSDDDNDDYGFHRRPSVRGIKPRFGSTTEIIQQIQSQLQPPPVLNSANVGSHMTWPYYTVEQKSYVSSDSSNTLITTDTGVAYTRTQPQKIATNSVEHEAQFINQSTPYSNRYSVPPHNFAHQPELAASNRECPIYRNQRMVQMRLSPIPPGQQVRLAAPNSQFKHEIASHYLMQAPPAEITSIIHVEQGQQQTIRVPYPTSGPVQVHLQTSRRSESPILQNQHLISVRSSQTSAMPYYAPKPVSMYPYYNHGPLVYKDHPKPNLCNNNFINSNSGSPMSSVTSSPTRSKSETNVCAERGVPEGAASVPMNYQQDSAYSVSVSPINQETVITLTPTSQPNSSVYYAMNV